jgi:hypothetical protein
MLIGITDSLKAEYQPPNDLTRELLDLLKRLEEKRDKQN